VQLSELENLYPIILLSFAILLISFLVTLILGYLPCFKMQKETYFIPLCIASTFPNIVALPIIIFPVLCEYEIVQDLVQEDIDRAVFAFDGENSVMEICNKQVNSVVFTYFFGFSVVFWSIGHRVLRNCKVDHDATSADERVLDDVPLVKADQNLEDTIRGDESDTKTGTPLRSKKSSNKQSKLESKITCVKHIAIDILKQPGFAALVLGFFTACIGPLQKALFEAGGSLRVIGSALESLSSAGTTFATIVVAASLVRETDHSNDINKYPIDTEENDGSNQSILAVEDPSIETSPTMNDHTRAPSFDMENLQEKKTPKHNDQVEKPSCKRLLKKICSAIHQKEMRISIWQIISRLVVTPGIVFLLLLRLELSGLLGSIPNIAKLVLLINSAVPGALVVVVILKAEGLTREAAAVSNTYLSSYTISVVTLAVWASIGLMAFRPQSGEQSGEF
jgi:predicted permease